VFADESHYNLLALGRSYALIGGERASRCKVRLRGKNYFILPALSLNGLLYLKVVEDEIDRYTFEEFVEGLLPHMNKWPQSNSVLVISSASIHDIIGLREMVEERGARLLYLPDYSPDYNPVDTFFHKAWLWKNWGHVNQVLDSELEEDEVYNLFWEAIHSVTMENAKAWYKTCGYRLPADVPE
jgi:hypothetical protein